MFCAGEDGGTLCIALTRQKHGAGEHESLISAGFEAVHWSAVGDPRASDAILSRGQVFAEALADQVFIAHITRDGQTERIAAMLKQWRVPVVFPP